ncbi:MAG: lysophospholipid acyltransferase family protein [Bacteroidales bacterium]|nr:lysophospholipid acyltransferase family protein [Bacteroidales bacterium]
MKKIGHFLFSSASYCFAILPDFILFGIADIIYFIIYYIINYRKKIVCKNLKKSFPEKSDIELQLISKKFYRQLGDTIIENIALFKMTKKRILQKVEFEETDIFEKLYKKNKNIVGVSAHLYNWELMLAIPKVIPHKVLGIYKPLNNNFVNEQINKMRSKFGATPVSMEESYKVILKNYKAQKLTFIGLIADQRPQKANISHWTTLLNQEAPFYNGPDKIAKKINAAVVFLYIERIKRGRYIIKFEQLFEDVSNCKEHEITEKYVKVLEKKIIENPAYWLWSHKRWKHDKNDPVYY